MPVVHRRLQRVGAICGTATQVFRSRRDDDQHAVAAVLERGEFHFVFQLSA